MRRLLLSILIIAAATAIAAAQSAFVRINQAGYLPGDAKVGIAFSKSPNSEPFRVRVAGTERVVLVGDLHPVESPSWGGNFSYYYELDLSRLKDPGKYFVELPGSQVRSREFTIGDYPAYQEDLLFFMRQQRCGYNPYLDMVCHQRDGRAFYSPLPDGTFVDASGGWHDAGDQLKYLITASNATARMILAYELERSKFADDVDDLGRAISNGIPDVLDEAKWGLDWIFRLHPAPDQL